MSEWSEAIGAACYRIVVTTPHIVYGTQFDRFGTVVPPNPRHMDCSGATSTAYWAAARIKIGGDTGAIANDVGDEADWVHLSNLQSGDLVMRRSGSVYNGGPDEHVGIFLYWLSDGRPVTFESAGSKNGVGYYPRARNFWRDGVRYKAVATASPIELPPVPLEDDDMNFLIKGDKRDETFLTSNFVVKRRTFDAAEETAIKKSGVLKQQETVHWPQAFVDRIPTIELPT